ncbi:MAG: glycosyltransferase, partial [Bacteroidetes bacterium]|nr:glycosyltransferase [Bacteroidota bacterium]
DLVDALRAAPQADIYNLRLFLDQEMLRPLYAASDAVLANSGHEPFGLVGLEAMAAGGIAFTGATGEEYAIAGEGAISLDTDNPQELVTHILHLQAHPEEAAAVREAAREQAAAYTWDHAVDVLLDKVMFTAQKQGTLTYEAGRHTLTPHVRDVVIYTVVHQPRRLRLPAEPLPHQADADTWAEHLFDAPMNERYFRKVAATCYEPAVARFQALVDRGLKLAIGFSLSFIEQAERWDPALLDRFRALVAHDHVELVAVEPTHSFLLLWNLPHFAARMQYAADRLEAVFGERPVVADTTEMMMSDGIYHALDQAGFKGGFMDGRPWIMDWRDPTHLYHHGGGQMKLLTRHYPLSDDVGYRFSDRSWDGWPLMADTYAGWLAGHTGTLVVLGWDFETFGEHHPPASGIFDFLDALPDAAHQLGLSFRTPSEAIDRHGAASHTLPLPAFASTWAGSGGLEFFLGNPAQQAVFHLMMQAYQKARLTGHPDRVDLALWLAQSDNLHLIQWYGRSGSEAEVSSYFTPQEWWALTPDGIIWEIQQVYKNFIAALDEPPAGAPDPKRHRSAWTLPAPARPRSDAPIALCSPPRCSPPTRSSPIIRQRYADSLLPPQPNRKEATFFPLGQPGGGPACRRPLPAPGVPEFMARGRRLADGSGEAHAAQHPQPRAGRPHRAVRAHRAGRPLRARSPDDRRARVPHPSRRPLLGRYARRGVRPAPLWDQLFPLRLLAARHHRSDRPVHVHELHDLRRRRRVDLPVAGCTVCGRLTPRPDCRATPCPLPTSPTS